MKDNLRHIFFELLRMGLWGKGKLSLKGPFAEDDWAILYQCAVNHTVEGILFDAFPFLTEDQLPPRALRMKWAVRVDQLERHNKRMNQVLADQYGFFQKNGFTPILLKGQGVAQYYPNPLHRVSGDIDWYFEKKSYRKAEKLLMEKGLLARSAFGFSLDYDWCGVHIEHHDHVFDIKNPFVERYLTRLLERSPLDSLAIHDQQIPMLDPQLQVFQVNVHIFKHLLGFGIGLRQICDAAILYHAYKSQLNGQALQQMYKRTGILKWVNQLHTLLVDYIGLSEADLPFYLPKGKTADWMMDEIWASGNFGFHDERFMNGKVSFVSVRPDGFKRLWHAMRLYFKYAPQEVIFFPLRRTAARLTGLFRK